MKLGAKIFFCYLCITVGSFFFAVDWIGDKFTIRYLEGVEDMLVDHANVLATLVGQQMEQGEFSATSMQELFAGVYKRSLQAKIYELHKNDVDINSYLTDAQGIVLFNAKNPEQVGADYSQWRDVYLTLRGEYGARSTRVDPTDDKSSELYVAAPVWANGELVGSLTVAKPMTNINLFIAGFKPQFVKVVLLLLGSSLVLSLLASFWITLPIKRLTQYARAVAAGDDPIFPKLDSTEIGEMGRAFASMQLTLEGKKYIEQYVQSLTHEIKSPVSAIRGAAELLDEPMEAQLRERFLANIHNEAKRINDIVERLLALSALEAMKLPSQFEPISLRELLEEVLASKQPQLAIKELQVQLSMLDDLQLVGDRFLLYEALANLLQNAMDFSAKGDEIRLTVSRDKAVVRLVLEDNGPGIPSYAMDKIFKRFYSLQRPDTGKKSTGLGLNFVAEVVSLHKGELLLANREPQGVRVELVLPYR